MEKQYIPKALSDAGFPPVKNIRDIQYIRYWKGERLVRVARLDPVRGIVGALYPSNDKNVFLGETIFGVDKASPKKEVKLENITDGIWSSLLIGMNPKEILKKYKPEMCGALPSGSYKFSSERNSRTFIIVNTEEPT